MIFFWFLMFLIFLIVEITTVNLITIWFCLGSIASLTYSYFYIDNVIIQFIIFIVVSLLFLLLFKPFIKKFRLGNDSNDFLDIVGKKGVVIKKVSDDDMGQVKVNGQVWSALSDVELNINTKIVVKGIKGVKLYVEKEEK